MRKSLFFVPALIATGLLLTGCSGGGEVVIDPIVPTPTAPAPTETTPPVVGEYNIQPLNDEELSLYSEKAEMQNTAFALSNQDFVVVLFGSSGCEPTVESVSSTGDGLELGLKNWGDVACTEDFAPTGWSILSTANFDWETMQVLITDNAVTTNAVIDKSFLDTPGDGEETITPVPEETPEA